MTADASRDRKQQFTLIGSDGEPCRSATPGTLGGYRKSKIYARLDCPTALRAIANGGFVDHRVFFLDAETATAAGYRPCGHCMRDEYRQWKATSDASDTTHSG